METYKQAKTQQYADNDNNLDFSWKYFYFILFYYLSVN